MGDILKLFNAEEYHRQFFVKGIRSDGRRFEEFRPAVVQTCVISTADGSSMIRQGDSLIIASIQAELGTPRADFADQGRVELRIEVSSAKPQIGDEEILSPQTDVQFCTDVIQSLLDNGTLVDLKGLCVEEGKLCLVLRCDVVVLDGTPSIDGVLMAVSAALHCTTLPTVILKPQSTQIDDPDSSLLENGSFPQNDQQENLFTSERIFVDVSQRRALKLNPTRSIASSFLLFRLKSTTDIAESTDGSDQSTNNFILADPSLEELKATRADDEHGSTAIIIGENQLLCGVYSSGAGAISSGDSFDHCLAIAEKRRRLVNRLIDEACSK